MTRGDNNTMVRRQQYSIHLLCLFHLWLNIKDSIRPVYRSGRGWASEWGAFEHLFWTGGGPAIPVEFGGGARSSLQPVPAQHSRCFKCSFVRTPLAGRKKSFSLREFLKIACSLLSRPS
jgi:hypothetical protein